MAEPQKSGWKLPQVPVAVIVIIFLLVGVVGFQKGYFDFGQFNMGKSMYDGTYSGTFNYEYRVIRGNGIGPWIPGSFDLTITLKDINAIGGRQYMAVTYAKCSDPDFGAVGGVTPSGTLSSVEFQANPPSGERLNDQNEAIIVRFPNTAYIEIPANAGGGYAGKFLISSSGLRYSADYPDEAWYAQTGQKPFKGYTAPGEEYYEVQYGSWSLTKISG
jgi:hypothetical protein